MNLRRAKYDALETIASDDSSSEHDETEPYVTPIQNNEKMPNSDLSCREVLLVITCFNLCIVAAVCVFYFFIHPQSTKLDLINDYTFDIDDENLFVTDEIKIDANDYNFDIDDYTLDNNLFVIDEIIIDDDQQFTETKIDDANIINDNRQLGIIDMFKGNAEEKIIRAFGQNSSEVPSSMREVMERLDQSKLYRPKTVDILAALDYTHSFPFGWQLCRQDFSLLRNISVFLVGDSTIRYTFTQIYYLMKETTCNANWRDVHGKTCDDYRIQELCTPTGEYGSKWFRPDHGSKHKLFLDDSNMLKGIIADARACPQCGCKVDENRCFPPVGPTMYHDHEIPQTQQYLQNVHNFQLFFTGIQEEHINSLLAKYQTQDVIFMEIGMHFLHLYPQRNVPQEFHQYAKNFTGLLEYSWSLYSDAKCVFYRTMNPIVEDKFDREMKEVALLYRDGDPHTLQQCKNHYSEFPRVCTDYTFTHAGSININNEIRAFVTELSKTHDNIFLFDAFTLFNGREFFTDDGRHYRNIKNVEVKYLLESIKEHCLW